MLRNFITPPTDRFMILPSSHIISSYHAPITSHRKATIAPRPMAKDRPPAMLLADAAEESEDVAELDEDVPVLELSLPLVEVPVLVDPDEVVVELPEVTPLVPLAATPVAAAEGAPVATLARVVPAPEAVAADGTDTPAPDPVADWAMEARGETARRARMVSCLGEYILAEEWEEDCDGSWKLGERVD